MRVRRSSDGRSEATLNLTPTIDVVFLLLIFFVATMQFPKAETNIGAYLPRKSPLVEGAGEKKEDEQKKENVSTIRISLQKAEAELQILLDGASLKADFGRLDRSLLLLSRNAAQTPNVQTEVVLDAERVVPYHHVVKALDLCAKHGFTNLSFAMPPEATRGKP